MMERIRDDQRLKLKQDTFFIPDGDRVYFRNNAGAFFIKGKGVYTLVEVLVPYLNGQYTLGEITEAFPSKHATAIKKLCVTLYENGFLKGVNRIFDPHEENVEEIEFLDYFTNDGYNTFLHFKNTRFFLTGKGEIAYSICNALLKLGANDISVFQNEEEPRVMELIEKYRQGRALTYITGNEKDIGNWMKQADLVIYASNDCDHAFLNKMTASLRDGQSIVPITYVEQVGLAGPLLHQQLTWREVKGRLQYEAIKRGQHHLPSFVSGATLASVAAFDIFKYVTKSLPSNLIDHVYLLDLEKLQGDFHPISSTFSGHHRTSEKDGMSGRAAFYNFIDKYTDKYTGLFTNLDRRHLSQIPFSQWRMNVAVPGINGMAHHREVIDFGDQHEEARFNTCLHGIEQAAAAYIGQTKEESECYEATRFVTNERVKVSPKEFQTMRFAAGLNDENLLKYGVMKQLLAYEWRKNRDNATVVAATRELFKQNDIDDYYTYLKTMDAIPELAYQEKAGGLMVVKARNKRNMQMGIGFTFRDALTNAVRVYLNCVQNDDRDSSISRSTFKAMTDWPENNVKAYLEEHDLDICFFEIKPFAQKSLGLKVVATLLLTNGAIDNA